VTDVLHAMSYGLRQRPTEGVVAAAPVAAVLLAFSLFVTMLRQSRPQSPDAAAGRGPADGGAGELPTAPMMFSAVDIVPAQAVGAVPPPPAPPIALPSAAAEVGAAKWLDWPTDDLDRPAAGPVTVAPAPEAVPTQEIPALADEMSDADPDLGPATREAPAPSAAAGPDVTPPPGVMPPTDATPPPTEENEALQPQTPPSAVAPGPTPESPPGPAAATADQSIRYASSAAAEQFADEDWEAEVDPALAGQVYPVLTSDPDIEVPPHQPGQSQGLEDDAPPFANAPFASVPRLNRVRVTPTPPTDDGDPDEE
jgi:hypothetical protein